MKPRVGIARVGIICDRRGHDGAAVHQANDEYVQAVAHGAGALPLLVPAMEPPLPVADLLAAFNGFVFSGSPSNVAPALYGGAAPRRPDLLDPARDAVSLPLMRAAIAAGKPVLCICRGLQELNVALGGTLHQHVHEIPGRLDHREDEQAPVETQYAPAHDIAIAPDGILAGIAGGPRARVNSLHHQGIDRLAPGLAVEAIALDGQIEAVGLPGAAAFLLGVQWHPEWRWAEDSLSRAIFQAFGKSLEIR